MAWNDLTIAQRSQLMNVFRRNGISSLSEMRRLYDISSPVEENANPLSNTAPMYAGGGNKNILNSRRYKAKSEKPIYDYLRWKGLNHQQASGFMGNLSVESYLDAELNQIGGPAYGLMQAEGSRKKAMLNYNEVPYSFGSGLTQEEQQQLDYIVDKGVNTYTPGEWGEKGFSGARKAREAFLNTTSTREASDIITNNFLRPSKPHTDRRREMSDYYDDKYSKVFPCSMEKYENAYLYNGGGNKIHIDPKNRGKFNDTKERTGKTTEELTHSKNPLTRKRAIFAQNASKWKHSHGGIKF